MPIVRLVGALGVIMIGSEWVGRLGFSTTCCAPQSFVQPRSYLPTCGLLEFCVIMNVVSKTCNKTSYEKTLKEAIFLMWEPFKGFFVGCHDGFLSKMCE